MKEIQNKNSEKAKIIKTKIKPIHFIFDMSSEEESAKTKPKKNDALEESVNKYSRSENTDEEALDENQLQSSKYIQHLYIF